MIREIIIMLAAAVLFSGCGRKAPEKHPDKILSLSCAATAVLTALQCPPAAVDRYGKSVAGTEKCAVIGRNGVVTAEEVARLGIGVCILWDYQKPVMEHLSSLGVKLHSVKSMRLHDYPQLVLDMGTLTGKEAESRRLAAAFLAELPDEKTEELKTVYFELYSPGRGAGDRSYIGDLLRRAGGKSCVEKSSQISAEHLLESGVEHIFFVEGFGDASEIASRVGLKGTPAVKKGNIHSVPHKYVIEGVAPLEAITFLKGRMK